MKGQLSLLADPAFAGQLRAVQRIAPGDGAARLLSRLVRDGLKPEALSAAAQLCAMLDVPRGAEGREEAA